MSKRHDRWNYGRAPLMDDHDRIRVAQMTSLRKRIDDGLASLDRCEGADGEQFMESLILSVDRKTRPAKG